jgi:two-component system, NarL family, sensor kinase
MYDQQEVPESIRQAIIIMAIVFLLLAGFIFIMVSLFHSRKTKMIAEKMKMKAAFDAELLRTQIEIQEATLKTISQEIHDNVGQVLSLAKLNMNFIETSSPAQQDRLNDTRNLVGKAIVDLRNLSRSMFGQMNDVGITDAISAELAILQQPGLLETEFETDGNKLALPPSLELVLFRISQEALHNILKHSKASFVKVELKGNQDQVFLKISDNGRGFDLTQKQAGIGLKSMQNRAALVGATFQIFTEPGRGTVIEVTSSLQPI